MTVKTKTFVGDNDLIIDLGMNNGDDTDYYLKKAARVVAVEANPRLCEVARQRFSNEIRDGRLRVLNVAVWREFGRQAFLVNLDNDHWSSLDPAWAGRDNSRCESVEVECVPLAYLFALSGVPRYMKIDVEGADQLVLQQLADLDYLPQYLSLEDCRFGYEYVDVLARCGYEGFKLQDQSEVHLLQDAQVGHSFPKGSSGPYGEQVLGAWLSRHDFERLYEQEVRDRDNNRKAPRTHWWDIHCAASPWRLRA